MLSVRLGASDPPGRGPHEATGPLRYPLRRHDLTRTHQSDGGELSMLSAPTDLTVWCRNGLFIWNGERRETPHPAGDPAGTARLISWHHRRSISGDDPFEEGAVPQVRASPVTGSVRV